MSCVRCERCSNIIDSDEDVECFTRDSNGRYGEGPCLCEPCRGGYYCKTCGEMPGICDDDCPQCLAEKYISGEENLADDMKIFPAIWTLPGYVKCLELVRASKEQPA